jgi:hypothetical protein
MDAAGLARAIREHGARALTQAEADALARSVENSKTDEELLANTLTAMRSLIAALGPGASRV